MRSTSMAWISLAALVVAVVCAAPGVTGQLAPDANNPQSFLTPHNAARSSVGVANLVWNATLQTYALNYANSQKAKCGQLVHSGGLYGENLFAGSGKAWTPKEAVDLWVAEKRDYTYATNSCASGKVCGHYTQVVWRATKQLGCASVLCTNGAVYIICSYNPPGNYVGQRPY